MSRDEIHYYGVDNIILSVVGLPLQPSSLDPGVQIGLTWGIWTSTLIAVNKFRTAYPGLDVDWEIHVAEEGYHSAFVGYGRLWTLLYIA